MSADTSAVCTSCRSLQRLVGADVPPQGMRLRVSHVVPLRHKDTLKVLGYKTTIHSAFQEAAAGMPGPKPGSADTGAGAANRDSAAAAVGRAWAGRDAAATAAQGTMHIAGGGQALGQSSMGDVGAGASSGRSAGVPGASAAVAAKLQAQRPVLSSLPLPQQQPTHEMQQPTFSTVSGSQTVKWPATQ